MAHDDNELGSVAPNLAPLPEHLTRAPEPWERDPRESDRAFAYFSLYRMSAYPEAVPGNPGPYKPRNVQQLARDVGMSPAHFYRLSSDHNWLARCAAYDQAIDRQRTHSTLTDVERMHEQHRIEYAELRETTKLALLRFREGLEAGTVQIKPSDIVALTKTLHEGERLLNGEATARTESKSLNVSVSLQDAPAEVREWYRARALAAQAEGAGT